jgi:subtilisin family serine protease
MATYEHLPLQRVEGELTRRKRPGFAGDKRVPAAHGPKIQSEIERVVEKHHARPAIADIDPSLILKVETSGTIGEDAWARLGLTVLATEPNKTVILFADDSELNEFRRRVEAYQGEIPEGQKGAPHAQIVDAIQAVDELSPSDRIGPVLRSEGIVSSEMLLGEVQTFDVELWPATEITAELFLRRVSKVVEDLGGQIVSQYRGRSALLARISASGDAFRSLLELPEVAMIDRPPEPDWPDLDVHELTIETTANILPASDGAIAIGVVDSGLTSAHPFLAGSVVSSFGEPGRLGDDDGKGHGTPVSGIAIYGDVQQHLGEEPIQPKFRVASAKVVNAQGKFDDADLVPNQMEKAIRRLHSEFGCRVINVSLADAKRPASTKPSAWAASLDELARELDILIVVAAGNAERNRLRSLGDGIAGRYPGFVLEQENRVLEPASAVNVITVGAIAHSNGLSQRDSDNVGVMPLAQAYQPSPFTRIGPGANGAIKPDLVDFGGTAVFDGPTQAIQDGATRSNAGILSLHSRYLDQLFATHSGTSYSAPLVAYKAGLIFEAFPDASANLTRALLALSAEHPAPALDCLQGLGDEAIFGVLGYGVADVDRATVSDDSRVVLFREDSLASDCFAVYEVPIPKEFQMGKGRRHVKVSLAFDPPVRHTRMDYMGTRMGFNLLRGTSAEEVFDAYRKWDKDEGEAARITGRLRCPMEPGIQRRERGTLQCSSFVAQRNIEQYGDSYFLAVRCESGWSTEEQRFAVAVELRHEADIELYQRVRERVRVRL